MKRIILSLILPLSQLLPKVTRDYVYSPIESKTLRTILLFIQRHVLQLSQQIGLNITRNDFYSPIPDLSELNNDLWSRRSELSGLNLDNSQQLELLTSFSSTYKNEYNLFPREKTDAPYEYYVQNRAFESVDGEVLYCMIRRFKPQRIIEIGSGFSTRLIVNALLKNMEEDAQYDGSVTVIDPYSGDLKSIFPHFPLQLIRQKVEDTPLPVFDTLSEGDILFIDSSHVLKTGGDVAYEYLQILPRIKKGVIVHIHDIFFPAEYPRKWLFEESHFYNEQYLLQAFLAFNNSFEVLWPGHYMYLNHREELKKAFYLHEHAEKPSSFWIRKTD
ncbi:MAG: class I SAM-dependent methyltransferase [Halobacteriota archaeon]